MTLPDLLADAGVQPGATHVRFWSFDGVYTETLTLEQAQRDDVLIAHHMLGKPVTREHGGPVRLYVAPMYGYKSLKWLERIEVVERARRALGPGLLGAARLRRRRVGRALERPRRRPDVTATASRTRRRRRRRRRRPLHRAQRWLHWSTATLVPGAAGHRHDALRAGPVTGGRATRAGEGHPRVQRPAAAPPAAARLRGALARRRPARRPPPGPVVGRRPALVAEPRPAWPAAHGQVQRRAEAQRHLRRRVHPADAGHRAGSCGGSTRSRWRGGRAPPSSTTGWRSPCSS